MRKACLNSIYKQAKQNDKIVFIGSDLGPGVLDDFKNQFPDRFFMEGVSEQYIIGMSAGLAFDGFLPFVNTISTFLTRRCLEQIIVDLCMHDLPVKLVGNGGGLVYAPLGPTHQAIDDIALMRSIPNMSIIAPSDANEMEALIEKSVDWPHPIYIRIAKGGERIISDKIKSFSIGESIIYKESSSAVILSTGIMTQKSLDIISQLSNEGIDIGLIHMHTIAPLDYNIINKIIKNVEYIFTLEEHLVVNGFGTSILEYCSQNFQQYPFHQYISNVKKSLVSRKGCQRCGRQQVQQVWDEEPHRGRPCRPAGHFDSRGRAQRSGAPHSVTRSAARGCFRGGKA